MRSIEDQVAHLRSLDLSTVSDHEAKRLICDLMRGYLTRTGRSFLPTAYRVRANVGAELFSNKGELWANPDPGVGRFNRAGEPILYLSSTPYGAMWEMRPQCGQMYTILACAQQFDSDPLRNFKIGSERFNPTAATGPLADHVAGGVRGSPGFMDELKIRGIEKQWILQDDFFADVVTRWAQPGTESDLYKVTIPLWEFLPGRSPDVDALMYPSVQHNLHAFNLALKLDAASVIRPVEAWVIDVREVVDRALPGERDLFGPITHRGEILEDGSIDWSPGDWSIQQVRTQFRQRVGVAPEIAGVSPILKYSEEEIDARRDEREKPNRTC